VKSGAVGSQVADQGKSLGTPGLNGDGFTVFEMPHVELASSGATVTAMGNAVDHQRAHTTDAFPAVRVEGNRVLTFGQEIFVHDVQHFKEGHFRDDVPGLVGLELS